MNRTVTIDAHRRPRGAYTWVASCRDGTQLIEWETGCAEVSFDRVAERDDVAQVDLIPITDGYMRICLVVQPGEHVAKKWVRTYSIDIDTHEQTEAPVIDTFVLLSDKPVYHHCHQPGVMVITTNPEP